ncbi:MAG: zf-HC2 domain-containing protein [Marinobacter sp.]|uniref:zf-HC2 domain-containing protein n=1 Tax=Marinobacter sp. TaxID=50741 RepID=UPI002B270CF2|nr:zf-HC2 domain-containing protein [Marinobacter sp.]
MLMCKDLAEIASDYIDGELATPQNLAIKMHLMMCRHCRSFIGNLRVSTDLMQAHSSSVPDEALMRKIDQRVAEALKARKKG